jgi:hypothetical protein
MNVPVRGETTQNIDQNCVMRAALPFGVQKSAVFAKIRPGTHWTMFAV